MTDPATNPDNPCDLTLGEAMNAAHAAFTLLGHTTFPEAGHASLSPLWYDDGICETGWHDKPPAPCMWCRAVIAVAQCDCDCGCDNHNRGAAVVTIRFPITEIQRVTKFGRPENLIDYMRNEINRVLAGGE